jgi:2-C-methyl-D-erythritol 2,4-cyclodiphosphate synthase
MRIGLGYDIHRLIASKDRNTIPVGGVAIPCYFKVEAHSDGDVLLHALTDACLGALALGDIGQWFPDSPSENQTRRSSDFLRTTLAEVNRLGYQVIQCDSVLFLEEPRIKDHWMDIRSELARALGIELSSVSVKAKSMEGMGPVGERKAIAAQVVVLLEKREPRKY